HEQPAQAVGDLAGAGLEGKRALQHLPRLVELDVVLGERIADEVERRRALGLTLQEALLDQLDRLLPLARPLIGAAQRQRQRRRQRALLQRRLQHADAGGRVARALVNFGQELLQAVAVDLRDRAGEELAGFAIAPAVAQEAADALLRRGVLAGAHRHL